MTTETFAALGLAEPLLRALNDADYTHPTPIQAKSIPALLAGRDLLGLAETGTGKTAAFVLPLLQKLAAEGGRPQPGAPRALILAPTRELAIQIGESIHAYGRHVRISHTVIFGGVGQRPQVSAIARGVDILVATPGRLIDLIEQRHLRLDQVRTFILDEADRMLDMGFVRDVRRILKLVPSERHSLLFSATMPDDIARLAAEILKSPVRVEIARAGKTVDRIDQRVIFVPAAAKRDVLARLLQDPEMRRVIVFTRTKRGADRISKAIEHMGVGVHAIHGNKSQGQRQSALDSFRKGFTRVLVATDIAARGIDIDEITHVVNYELPNIPESYVHRIGRTARAGASGVAIALCAPDEREYLRDIEKLTGRALTVVPSGGGERGAARAEPQVADARGDTSADAARPPHRDRSEADRPERTPPRREARPGEHRHSGRDGAPRGDRRDERRERDGHAPRNGAPHRGRDGASQGDSRADRGHGERHPSRHGGAHDRSHDGDRRNGEGRPQRNGAPHHAGHGGGPRNNHRNGENRPQRNGNPRRPNEASSNGSAREDAPQPWRNWTRGDGVSHQDGQRPARPAKSRSQHRRGEGGPGRHPHQTHHRGRDAR